MPAWERGELLETSVRTTDWQVIHFSRRQPTDSEVDELAIEPERAVEQEHVSRRQPAEECGRQITAARHERAGAAAWVLAQEETDRVSLVRVRREPRRPGGHNESLGGQAAPRPVAVVETSGRVRDEIGHGGIGKRPRHRQDP